MKIVETPNLGVFCFTGDKFDPRVLYYYGNDFETPKLGVSTISMNSLFYS
jgi:hypothetical protein